MLTFVYIAVAFLAGVILSSKVRKLFYGESAKVQAFVKKEEKKL